MENSIDRYQRIANSTCSPMDEAMLGRLYSMQGEILALHNKLLPLLEHADVIKKFIFYNKRPDSVMLGLTPYAKLGEHMQLHPTNQSKLDMVHGILGWTSESGEVLNWATVFSRQETTDTEWSDAVKNLKEESGDFAWYTAIMARGISVSLSEIFNANNRKLLTRYKGKYSHDQAKVRDIEAEMAALDATDAVVEVGPSVTEIKFEFPVEKFRDEMESAVAASSARATAKLFDAAKLTMNSLIDKHNGNMKEIKSELDKLSELKSKCKSDVVGWLIAVGVICVGLPAFSFLAVVGIGIFRWIMGE